MQVFISHSPIDSMLAARVAKVLKGAGLGVWLADERILPGDNWAEVVAAGLEKSDAMVILLTPDAIRGSNIQLDLGYALGREEFSGRVIPVAVGEADDFAPDDIPWVLRRMRIIRVPSTPNDAELHSIAQALYAVADRPALQPA